MAASKAVLFVELIDKDNDQVEFRITDEGRQIIESINNKLISVITIAGPQRTGKSFLANRLLNRMSGFAIGPSTVPCTKGIWIWSQPVQMNDMMVVIMDTEGLFSVFRNTTTDSKILALSLLLSTILIYNSFGHIDEAAIENIGLVARLVDMIKVDRPAEGGAEAKPQTGKELAKFFPYFIWCLRDFSLDLAGKSSDQYLEDCFRELEGKDPVVQQKNQTRRSIKEMLKDRSCLTFVRPVVEEHKLSKIEELNYQDLRPEFRQSVKEFLSIVNSQLKPKMVNGKGISGKMFIELAQSYVAAFNKGGCPEILPSLERVIAHEVNKLSKEKLKLYSEVLDAKLKEMASVKDAKELFPMFNALTIKLEADLWAVATRRLNYDLYWMARENILRELRDQFSRHLDSIAEKKKAQYLAIKSTFSQKLVPPKKSPLETYFSVNRLKEFNKLMVAWLEKSLDTDNKIAAELVAAVCDYFEKMISTGTLVIQEELDKKADEVEVAVQSNKSMSNILREQQMYAEELKEDLITFKQRIARQDRELDGIKQASDGNSTHLYNRIAVLEQEIEDLKIERDTARLSAKNSTSSKLDTTHSQKSTGNAREEDLTTIEDNMEKLIAKGSAGDEAYYRIFEQYKQAVGREMTKMKKNMNIVRQENDYFKGLSLEIQKKDEKINSLIRKIEEFEAEKQRREQTMDSTSEYQLIQLKSELMAMTVRRDNLMNVLEQTVQKLKKKTNTLANAVEILDEEDRQDVLNVFRQYNV